VRFHSELSAIPMRAFSEFMPRASSPWSCASTIRCAWFDCTEYTHTRKASRDEALIARTRSACVSDARNDSKPSTKRSVTLTGSRPLNLARLSCATPARAPFGLRPAPRRLPPQRTTSNSSCVDALFLMKSEVHRSRDPFGEVQDSSRNLDSAAVVRASVRIGFTTPAGRLRPRENGATGPVLSLPRRAGPHRARLRPCSDGTVALIRIEGFHHTS